MGLGTAPLWFDETYTSSWMSGSWQDTMQVILRGSYGANHLPLYFLILKIWTTVGGTTPFALRLPSVAFHVLAVVFTAALARSSAGRRCEPWAAWMAALSPFLLHHAHEARMYTMIVALCASSVYLVSRYIAGTLSRLPAAFFLINLALVETHHYAPIFLAGQGLALLAVRRHDWRNWLPMCLAVGLLALVPLSIAIFVASHEAGASYGLGWLAIPGSVWVLLTGYGLVPSGIELHAAGRAALAPYVPAILCGAAAAGILISHGVVGLKGEQRVLLTVVPLVALTAPFAATLVLPDVNYNPRYAAIGLAPLIVLVARPLGSARNPVVILCAVVLMALALVSTGREAFDPGFDREDVNRAGAWLDSHAGSEEIVLVATEEMLTLADFHWPRHKFQLYPKRGTVASGNEAGRVAAAIPIRGARTYYVMGRSWLVSPDGSLQREVRARYPSCGILSARGVEIYCLMPPPPPGTDPSPAPARP